MAYVYYPAVSVLPVASAAPVYPATTYVSTGYYVPAAAPMYYYCYQLPCCKCSRVARAEANRRGADEARERGRERRSRRHTSARDAEPRAYSISCDGVMKPEKSRRVVSVSPVRESRTDEKAAFKEVESDGDGDWVMEGKVKLHGTVDM
ncbi:hypothetical protein BESB_085020 [Besnoitia besnoiti]|uniref:Uncharacterized protein n=1 Tax=Besnoitia besnoiti TaxID=94643 RepID=A0A2A9MCA8_BESBE|nr:hypothetical protein BESB_085020 [Besnoitia besnoiti]PFH33303.1 hypothetical protein BESB_085020 [Besnoitia besnoiti]